MWVRPTSGRQCPAARKGLDEFRQGNSDRWLQARRDGLVHAPNLKGQEQSAFTFRLWVACLVTLVNAYKYAVPVTQNLGVRLRA